MKMAEEEMTLQPRLKAIWGLGLVLLLKAALLVVLVPDTYIDTFNYAKNIVDHLKGGIPAAEDPFYDFGHVLLRPFGAAGFMAAGDWLQSRFEGHPLAEIFAAATVLIGFNALAGLVAAALFGHFLHRETGSLLATGVAGTSLIATHAYVNFSMSGNAYMMGAAAQIVFLAVCAEAIRRQQWRAWKLVLCAGGALGLSVGIWFPNVLPIPGLLAFALLWRGSEGELAACWRDRLQFLARILLVAGAVVVLAYLPAMISREIHDLPKLLEWVKASRYQIEPTNGVARMIFSIPRGFYEMGSDNTVLKGYLLGARESSLLELAAASWKHAFTYGFAAVIVWSLWRRAASRTLLACLIVMAIPLGIFAAFLFDPSPPERYMALFPLFFLAAGIAFKQGGGLVRASVGIFLLSLLLNNGLHMWRWGVRAGEASTAARLESVAANLGDADLVFVPSPADEVLKYLDRNPFEWSARRRFSIVALLPTGSPRIVNWKEDMARQVITVWANNGRIWVSSRMLKERPEAPWWIDGDESRLKWQEVPEFFRSLEFGTKVGGEQGFWELSRTAQNEARIDRLTKQGNMQ